MNTTLQLRSLEADDLPQFKQWLQKPHVAMWYHDPQDWIEEAEKRNDEYKWIHHLIAEFEGRPIGFCQYYDCRDADEDWYGTTDQQNFSIDYMIGDTDYLKKGLGKAIVVQLIEIIRKQGGNKIIVQPEPENHSSCQTLLSCGFQFDTKNNLYKLEL